MSRIDTVKTEVFKFAELSGEVQQEVIENWYSEGLDYDWWDLTYDDADRIGLKITSFDLDRMTIEGEFTESLEEVCRLIMAEHGGICDTYKTAELYSTSYSEQSEKWEHEDDFADSSDCEDMAAEFLCDLLEDYRIILSKEYNYQTSEETIKENIEANDYEFTAEGELY
jgi:hypothetical protein